MPITVLKITPNGNIPIKKSASSLDEMTRSLPQGFYTTFSTLAHGTRVAGLQAHLERLYLPAKEMGLNPAVDEKTLRERIAQIASGNLPHESRIRLILTKDSAEIFAGIEVFKRLPETVYANGVHVITAPITRQDPRIKDTSFISESAAQRLLLNRDVFEVLLIKHGSILEGMTSNFYAIKSINADVELITAQRGILAGVTRKAVLRIAREQGLTIKYRAPRLDEKFNEAFLTSSSRGVVPIVSIDNKSVGQGRVGKWTKMLSRAYQAYIQKCSEKIVA
ncbi:MAG: aminotransferase class IV [Anaerolineales bacterium]